MLNPSTPAQVRSFFYHAWQKYKNKDTNTSALENLACECILIHPEYNKILEDPYCIDKKFSMQENPFLHLSMHLSIIEQVKINQPHGIQEIFNKLITKYSYHEAIHIIIECLQQVLINAV